MSASRYRKALQRVLVHEGGRVDDPRDPGGRTNQGVIQRVYDGYRRRKNLPPRDVFLMEAAERDDIYRRQYWDAVRGDELPTGIDYVVFDGAVNSGPVQSIKWLQRALGVHADGVIGQATLAAIDAAQDHDLVVAAICARRMAFLRQLRHWPTFGRGWSKRVANVEATGQAWATGSVGPQPVFDPAGARKARVETARPAPSQAPGDLAAGSGVATGGLGGALDQAKDQLAPLAGTSSWIDTIVAGLVVTGLVLAVGGIGWRLWTAYRARRRAEALDLVAA